jgi:uncharacterized repeat protein (TIGR01451 family)
MVFQKNRPFRNGAFLKLRKDALTISLAMLMAVLFFVPGMAQAVVNLKITKLADDTSVEAGSTIVYRLQYTVASTTENALNAVITDILPVQLASSATDVTLEGDDFVASALYTAATRTARFVFESPLAAGTTGTLLVRCRFPLGTTIDGTIAENTATFSADNGTTAVSAPAAVTSISSFRMTPVKDRSAGGALDAPTTFRLRLRNPSPNVGGLNLLNTVIVDSLPAGVVFVSATNSGAYNPTENTVTWNLGTVNVGSSSTTYPAEVSVTVIFPSSVFSSNSSVTNRMYFTGTPYGLATPVSGSTSYTGTLTSATAGMSLSKANTTTSNLAPVGSSYLYRFNLSNTGYFALDSVYIEDSVPARVELTTFQARGYLSYKTHSNSSWTQYNTTYYSSLTTVPVTALGLASGDYVTDLRYDIGTLAYPFTGWSSSTQPGYGATVLATDRSGNAVIPGQTIVNTARASYAYAGTRYSRTATNTITVYDGSARPRIEKVNTTNTSLKPGQTATYELRLRNNLPAVDNLTNAVIADLLDANLTYVPNSWTLYSAPAGTPAPLFEILEDYNSPGRTLLRWAWRNGSAYGLAPNAEIRIRFQATLKNGIPPNTSISNTAYIVGFDNPTVSLGSAQRSLADTYDLDSDLNSTELFSASNAIVITVGELATLESVKWVKGQSDADWSRYPNTGLTVPGGTADYRLIVRNVGNVPATRLVVIDILPFVGDAGVIDLSPRNSEWRPNLTGTISGPSGITVYYSTSGNPTRPEVEPSGPPGSEAPNWSTDPPADITSVRSLKIDFGDRILQPQNSVELSWSMRAPVGAPDNGEIAWNSFGFVAYRSDDGSQILPAEPFKVGIAIQPGLGAAYGDYVWIDTNLNGSQDDGEVGLNGVTVDLYEAGGDGQAGTSDDSHIGTTVTGDNAEAQPGYYLFPEIPAGNYFAKFTLPANVYFTPGVDSDPVTNSDANPSNGRTPVTAIALAEKDTTWDAGVYRADAAYGNRVWLDLDRDGIQDPGDEGVENVRVILYHGNGSVVDSLLTGADGMYLFSALHPGDYYARFRLPEGYLFSPANAASDDSLDSDADRSTGLTATTTIMASEADPTWDTGIYLKPATIGDRVWHDTDLDGIQDGDEAGVGGVIVTLLSSSGSTVATDTTDTAGYYLFPNLTPGVYVVRITRPEGFAISAINQGGNDTADSDVDPATGRSGAYTLSPDQSDLSVDAGIYKLATLGDFVWDDSNHDGIQDASEAGVMGVTVRLYNSSGIEVGVTTTNDQGHYLFRDLAPGSYTVGFSTPSGYEFTLAARGGSEASDSDADETSGRSGLVTLPTGEDYTDLDAGIFKPASVGDRVWLDRNGNGLQDSGEEGLPGITVLLYSESGTLVGSTATGGGGAYLFDDLLPGSYEIRFQRPDGYLFSPRHFGSPESDSDADRTTGSSGTFALNSGDHIRTLDAGLFQPASAGDWVWYDLNQDGQQSAGEPGVPGNFVTLYNPAGIAVAKDTTDASGAYLFEGLVEGSYTIAFELPDGTIFTRNGGAASDALNSDPDPSTGRTPAFTLSPGEHDSSLDAGLIQLASLGDYVWNDDDNDGLQDDGEAGIGGVTVILYRDNGTPVDTTSTDGNGFYSFASLLPGSYYIEVIAAPPVIFSPVDQESNDAIDSDVTRINDVTGRTMITELLPGENDPSWDAGIYLQLASIGSYAWFDLNRDGLFQAGEPPMAGVTVRLHAQNGTILSEQVTAGDGHFIFSHLAPNTYYLSFVPPAGYALTYFDRGSDAMTNSDADESSKQTTPTALGQGENDLTWGAGFFELSSLGNYVWYDFDRDGRQNGGEAPVGNVRVDLRDGGGQTLRSTLTDADGFYYFPDLMPGNYTIRFILPAHSIFSTYQQGGDVGRDSDAQSADGATPTISLGLAVHDSTWDAGLIKLASIGDYIWEDTDADGVQDESEFGIPAVRLLLLDSLGTVVAQTITDEEGSYLFDDVIPGCYTVQVDESSLPRSYVTSTFNNPMRICLEPDAHRRDADFGYRSNYGSIGDLVWFDINRNGLQDAGEPGIPNVLIRLEEIETGETAKTLTNGEGKYLFRTLLPGIYRVYVEAVSLTEGYFLTSAQSEFTVTLGDQQHYREADFGYWREDTGCNKLVLAWYEPWYDNAQADSSLRHWNPANRGGMADTSLFEFFSSRDPLIWEYDILLAWASGIDGFVVDWFGRSSYENAGIKGLLDTADRLEQRYHSQGFNFQIICSYNERSIGAIDSNMVYIADSLMSHRAYWGTREGRRRPLFIFNQPELRILPETYRAVADSTLPKDAFLVWNGTEDEIFVPMDVVYPWVQTLIEKWDDIAGRDWGKPYLDLFSSGANSPAAEGNLLFGIHSVWPGYDDRNWTAGSKHWMSRRDTLTYRWTWEEAMSYQGRLGMPWIVIETWNDHNRGSAIQPSLEWNYKFIVKTRDYIRNYKRECHDYDFEDLGLLVPQHIHQARIAARLWPDQAQAILAKTERALDLFFARRHLDAISLADDAAGISAQKVTVIETPLTGIKISWEAAPNATGYVLYKAKDRSLFNPCSFERPDSIFVGSVLEYTLQREDRDKLYLAVVPVNATINRYANSGWFKNNLSGADVVSTVASHSATKDLKPNQLVFITGTETHSKEGWEKAVDGITVGWDGTTTALSPEYGNAQKSPWAIFGFADGGLYKFNYLVLQTDNGTDDDSEPSRQAVRFQVLVSTTTTEDADFKPVYTARIKSGAESWYPLGAMVKARYVKLVLLEPVYSLYRQVVEFQVQDKNREGALPASEMQELAELPSTYKLEHNYPNPFNGVTKIRYQLPEQVLVSVKIYDVMGREVATLVNGIQPPGIHETAWRPQEMASGIYFYRITAGRFSSVQRMLYLK